MLSVDILNCPAPMLDRDNYLRQIRKESKLSGID